MAWIQHVYLDRNRLIMAALLFSLVQSMSARVGNAQSANTGRDSPPQVGLVIPAFDNHVYRLSPPIPANEMRLAALPANNRANKSPRHETLRRLPAIDDAIANDVIDVIANDAIANVGFSTSPNEPIFPAPSIKVADQPTRRGLSPNPLYDADNLEDVWWRPFVTRPRRSGSQPLNVTLDHLIGATLQYSDQVKVYSDTPLIRDLTIIEEDAEFDWVGFTESMWNDVDEPVGSTLTTGGPERFKDQRWETRAGLRRRSTSGGRFEVYQEFQRESSNSIFFLPNDQGASQLTLSYSQPILRGAGRVYNSSLILLAQIDATAARDEFSRQLQAQLLDVSESYWKLYQQRATFLQKERLYQRGQVILEDLEHRAEVDALASQIVLARAAVATRNADLIRATTSVKNAESRIRSLVNAPQLGVVDQFEFLPLDEPSIQFIPVSMSDALALAIRNRPELHQVVKRIKAAAVRLDMSKNELLPVFDLVLETYVRGLRGDFDVGGAVKDSFSDGSPSYSAGIQMEFPLGNRAALASVRRRNIEMRQLQNQFRATVDVLQLEVEVVVREVQTAYQEIKANFEAMKAAEHEVDYITKRWQLLSGEDRSAALILEDLLAAQDRLAIEELEFVHSQIVYNQSLTDLKQVTGTLLQVEQIDVHSTCDSDGNPVLLPIKAGSATTTFEQ